VQLAVRLARATRPDDPRAPATVRSYVRFGAGPRGSQALVLAANLFADAVRDAFDPRLIRAGAAA